MGEFYVLCLLEAIGVFVGWPRFMYRRGGLHNPAMIKDNPHLKKCRAVWRWSVPCVFTPATLISFYILESNPTLQEDWLILNLVALFFSLIIGVFSGELLGDYFRTHPETNTRRSYRRITV